jgi:hypothetical protein
MKPPFRSSGILGLAVAATLASLACTTTANVSPKERGPLPFVEHPIYVTLPGRGASDKTLREQYGERGRWAIGHTRALCVKGDTSSQCRETVNVRITAVEGARYISPDKSPTSPQLLAWVENLGAKATDDGFEPATSFVYALVVDAPTASDPEQRPVIHMIGFSTDPKRSSITQSVYGHVFACHDYTYHLISEADFQPCHRQQKLYGNGADKWPLNVLVSAFLTWTSSASLGDPTWFACSTGCCTSRPPT